MSAKKHLGQNFLKSKAAIARMVEAGAVHANDIVLEIGPGKGALTKALLATGAHVVAVEKDVDLIPLLQEKFAHEIATQQLELIEGDVLSFDPARHATTTHGYKLIANIPYYITGELLEYFLAHTHQPERAVLLVQKEVAQRIVARDERESILSLSVKVFGTPKLVMTVSKKYFSPAPKVDSAILCITDISRENFAHIHERDFFTIVKAGFAHKRKVLSSNLSHLFTKEALEHFLKTHGHDVRVRAEELSLSDWLALSTMLNQHSK